MEPVTHFLTGACLARTGFNRKTALATLTMTLAAEANDIDMVAYFKGPTFGFAHHRGITHTLIGVPFVAAAVLLLVWIIARVLRRFGNQEKREARLRKRGLPTEPRWGLLYLLAVIACLTHLLLDFTNNYGIRPFEPFSYKWYAWDTVFIYEPLLYVALIGGLVLPALFGLINEEIGSRARKPRGQVGAILGLVGVLAVWGLRDFEHSKAVSALDSRVYQGGDPIRVSAFAYPLNPFHWYGVAETTNFYARMEVINGEVDPHGQMTIRYKPQENDATEAAKKSYLGRAFLDWARYPVLESESRDEPQRYIVRFIDMRFRYPDNNRAVLSPRIEFDGNMKPIGVWWGERKDSVQ
ncbi:MAG TPA: metal-dependent hydrolase [Terriglobales bacterium]|nr:metal-dependent hydrolase [Terriglobales bacterium]